MKCQFCKHEVDPQIHTVCPECDFPINGEGGSCVAATAVTAPSQLTQPAHVRSLRPGSICLTKQNDVFAMMALYMAFALDLSGSMIGKKRNEAIRGLMLMIESLLPLGDKCHLGICEFNETARIAHPLTHPAALEGQLVISEATGGTNIGAGLRLGGQMLRDCAIESDTNRANINRVIILLSDGRDSGKASSSVDEADLLKGAGHLIIAVAYGEDADHDVLQAIASSPDLFFVKGANGNELETFLKTLGGTLTASVAMGEDLHRSLQKIS